MHVAGRVRMTILVPSSNQHHRWQLLPRGPGLSPISRVVIGLANHFGSIIVKCRPIGVYITMHSALGSTESTISKLFYVVN